MHNNYIHISNTTQGPTHLFGIDQSRLDQGLEQVLLDRFVALPLLRREAEVLGAVVLHQQRHVALTVPT